MKKKLLAAIALFCAYLVGCSDNDSSSNSTMASAETAIDTASYTVIIYGTSGGDKDSMVEDVYKQMQPMMESHDVRVLFFYKYGKDSSIVEIDEEDNLVMVPFTGKYAEPGQLVSFELTKDTDLKTIKENARMAGDSVMLHNPGVLSSVLDYVADSLPAKNYVFVLWGHGAGFDYNFDYPRELRLKSSLAKSQGMLGASQTLAAVAYDEWTLDFETFLKDGLNLYDLKREIENSSIKHFKGIYFHNCFMGNFETLSEIYSYADYIIASEHVLESGGTLISNFVKELYNKKNNFQQAIEASFDESKEQWMKENEVEKNNGDISLLKASEVSSFFPIFEKIAKRLNVLYKDSDQKEKIDYATTSSYYVGDFEEGIYFIDALNYIKNLASVTKDSSLTAYATELKDAFEKLILKKMECHYNKEQDIGSFSLSVDLSFHDVYNNKSVWGYTNKEAYEYTTFHKKTEWGNWLDANTAFEYRNQKNGEEE